VILETLGMTAGKPAISGHRISIDPAEPAGLADTTPFGEMLKDRLHLFWGEPSVEEWSAFAFGEAGFASPAAEHAFDFARTVVSGDGEGFVVPLAVVGAGGI